MKDKSIMIVLKGGMQIQENIKKTRMSITSVTDSSSVLQKWLEKKDEIWYNTNVIFDRERD